MGRVAVGSMVANVCAYLVHLPASVWLSADAYGEFAVLLQVTLVLGVPALAVQAVAAREVVTGRPVASLLRLGGATAAAVAVAAVLAVTPVMTLAHTGFIATTAAVAVAPLLVLISVGQGILQGRGRFHRLAWVIGSVGVVRTVPPLIALAAGGGPAAALVATLVGAVVAVGVVAWCSDAHDRGESRTRGERLSPTTVLHASQVQLVLISATSVDLLFARVVLSEHDSGVYALGTVAAKVAFWLPQAVGLVLFPRLADARQSAAALRTGVSVLVGFAGMSAVASVAAGPLVPIVIGEDYRPVAGLLWLFAMTGGALAIAQVALLAAIARERTRIALLPWAVLGAEAVAIEVVADSVLTLAVTAAAGAVVTATLTVAATMRARARVSR